MHKSNVTSVKTNAGDEQLPAEVTQIGTFGANEFEEGLLSTMARFQE